MSNTPILKTERLLLRRFSISDSKAFFNLMGDEEVNKYLPLFPTKSIEEAQRFLAENYLKSYEKTTGLRYAVCLHSTDIPIGYVNVSEGDSFDLGYGLKRNFWGKGIITEACKAIIEQLKHADIPYITATHDVNNPKSGEVMKRIGMTYRYSYQELWQPKNLLVVFRMYQLNLNGDNEPVYRKYWEKYPVHFVESDV